MPPPLLVELAPEGEHRRLGRRQRLSTNISGAAVTGKGGGLEGGVRAEKRSVVENFGGSQLEANLVWARVVFRGQTRTDAMAMACAEGSESSDSRRVAFPSGSSDTESEAALSSTESRSGSILPREIWSLHAYPGFDAELQCRASREVKSHARPLMS